MDRLIGFDPQLLADAAIVGVNVLILFAILTYLLFDPVRKVLNDRRERIAAELQDAASKEEKANAMKAEYEFKLKDINKEADRILEDARKKAKIKEEEILSNAREEAERITDRANKQIEMEKKKAMDDMKQEIVGLAAIIAQKAITSSMNVDVQASLVDETLKEMGEGIWQN
ncbi:MAG: F0F1 ATP synthase subunit B [Lachnospiraceae bacterium]|nr:F0F1 ATP synthase subunit B [Lachnospiraceae bacterium]